MEHQSRPLRDTSQPAPDPEARTTPISSDALFGGGRQIEIRHQGEIYRLQITRSNKLILTK